MYIHTYESDTIPISVSFTSPSIFKYFYYTSLLPNEIWVVLAKTGPKFVQMHDKILKYLNK